MKEYKQGFTTKHTLDNNGGKKSSWGEEIEISTDNGSIVMRVIGDEYEIIHMNIREAKLLSKMLNDAVKKVNS